MTLRKLSLVHIASIILITGMLASQFVMPTAAVTQNFTFNPVADSYVNAASSATNYGTSTSLQVDASPILNSYLRFNVSGLAGQPISQVRLLIHANSVSTQGLIIKSVQDETWGETTINYNNAPPMGKTVSSSGGFPPGSWIPLDVTAYVTGEGTYSFGVSTPESTNLDLSSRESGADAPQLIVSTIAPVTTVTATRTPTRALTPTGTVLATRTPTSTPLSTGTRVISPTPTKTSLPTATPVKSPISHVFVVLMENRSYNEVWNKSTTPYITSLGNAFARATNYFAITHPSLPNYLDLYGGSNYTITTDCSPSSSCHVNATNLADNLNAKGLTWKGYMESMPAACRITTSGNYAPKHDPFIYFDDIRNNTARCDAGVVPYTALAADLKSAATTPNYAFITPNQCNDMHSCSISTGDTWLKNNLPAILNSPACKVDKCLLILTWDEDDSSQGNKVLTIFAGSGARTGGVVSSVAYTHFSLLKTVETIFSLPTQTSKDAAASPMLDLLR
jgi:acid phosphatase